MATVIKIGASPWAFDPQRQRLCNRDYPNHRIKGLLRPLRRTFFSQYRYKPAPSASSHASRKGTGRKGGRDFDEQVTRALRAKMGQCRSNTIQAKRHWGVDKYLSFLSRHGYIPVAVQLGVGSMSFA